MMDFFNWVVHSDGGLPGAPRGWRGNLCVAGDRRSAPQWPRGSSLREYLLLVACVGVALVYGILNDQVTVSISREYFLFARCG